MLRSMYVFIGVGNDPPRESEVVCLNFLGSAVCRCVCAISCIVLLYAAQRAMAAAKLLLERRRFSLHGHVPIPVRHSSAKSCWHSVAPLSSIPLRGRNRDIRSIAVMGTYEAFEVQVGNEGSKADTDSEGDLQ